MYLVIENLFFEAPEYATLQQIKMLQIQSTYPAKNIISLTSTGNGSYKNFLKEIFLGVLAQYHSFAWKNNYI